MPYQNNIPLAPDQLSRSQGDINGNFQILGAIGGIPGVNNSSGINVAPGAGFNYVFLSNQALIPPVATFGADVALYNATNPAGPAGSGQRELYISKQLNTVGTVQIPSTASILGNSNPGINTNGWTYLPSGIIMKWGIAASVAPRVSVNLNGFGPNFTQIFNAQVTCQSNLNPPTNTTTISPLVNLVAGFTLYIGNTPASGQINNFYWLVIGR